MIRIYWSLYQHILITGYRHLTDIETQAQLCHTHIVLCFACHITKRNTEPLPRMSTVFSTCMPFWSNCEYLLIVSAHSWLVILKVYTDCIGYRHLADIETCVLCFAYYHGTKWNYLTTTANGFCSTCFMYICNVIHWEIRGTVPTFSYTMIDVMSLKNDSLEYRYKLYTTWHLPA